MLYERIKIPVAVKQCQSLLNAAGGDQCVDGFSYRDALRPQGSKVLGRLDSDIWLNCPSNSSLVDLQRSFGAAPFMAHPIRSDYLGMKKWLNSRSSKHNLL